MLMEPWESKKEWDGGGWWWTGRRDRPKAREAVSSFSDRPWFVLDSAERLPESSSSTLRTMLSIQTLDNGSLSPVERLQVTSVYSNRTRRGAKHGRSVGVRKKGAYDEANQLLTPLSNTRELLEDRVDLVELLVGEGDVGSLDVLERPLDVGRTGDGNDVLREFEKVGESELGRRNTSFSGEGLESGGELEVDG